MNDEINDRISNRLERLEAERAAERRAQIAELALAVVSAISVLTIIGAGLVSILWR